MWTKEKISEALKINKKFENIKYIREFSFDTRTIKKDDCFLALKTEQSDGHDFIQDAYKKGASCVISEKNGDFNVKSVNKAIVELGQYAKNKSNAKRIAITGSVGKTTTKHFLNQVLSKHFTTISSYSSFNNHIGVPLTLTRLRENTQVGIFEIGSNHPGEIESLSKQVSPDIAIITKIGKAHIGMFDNKSENIIKEKMSILNSLKKDGIAIIPYENLSLVPKSFSKKIVTFGRSEKSDVSLISINQNKVKIKLFKKVIEYEVGFLGDHLIENTLIIWAVSDLLGIKNIATNKLIPCEGRGVVHKIPFKKGEITVIDDSYNAPYEGMVASINHLAKNFHGRKILVLGDFGEVGEFLEVFHKNIYDLAQSYNIKDVICVGPCMAIAFGVNISKNPLSDLYKILKPDDVILFKGSFASGLHKIVSKLI